MLKIFNDTRLLKPKTRAPASMTERSRRGDLPDEFVIELGSTSIPRSAIEEDDDRLLNWMIYERYRREAEAERH